MLLGLVVLPLSAVTAADHSSEQAQEIDALRAELAATRAENQELKARLYPKDMQLQSEISMLIRDAADLDDEIDLAGAPPQSWRSSNTCPTRCNGNCWIGTKFADANCTLAETEFVHIQKAVAFKKASLVVPSWDIWHKKEGEAATIRGTIRCPCTKSNDGGNTVAMSMHEASKVIIGQVAAMGIPSDVAESSLGQNGDNLRIKAAYWNAKVAVSVINMLRCWRSKCEIPESGTAELQLGDRFGGGAYC